MGKWPSHHGAIVSICSLLALTLMRSCVLAQPSTSCDPLEKACPADPALGKAISYDFTKGASSDWTLSTGAYPTFDSSGAQFTIAKSLDSPTMTSKWYMMFGHYEVTMKTSPGVGVISSLVLQSDDLDEIDFEWLGADNKQVQTNYFGKGVTGKYDRGGFHANAGNHDDFHTYSVDWTSDKITWAIDGQAVRTLTPQTAETNQYPQTPMQMKIGTWPSGDPSEPAGVITWGGGPIDYGKGPFTMTVKSVKAIDYSTGQSYSYGDHSGTWQSIKSDGGKINSAGDPNAVASAASMTRGFTSPSGNEGSTSSGGGSGSSTAAQSTTGDTITGSTGAVDNTNDNTSDAGIQTGSATSGGSADNISKSGSASPPSATPGGVGSSKSTTCSASDKTVSYAHSALSAMYPNSTAIAASANSTVLITDSTYLGSDSPSEAATASDATTSAAAGADSAGSTCFTTTTTTTPTVTETVGGMQKASAAGSPDSALGSDSTGAASDAASPGPDSMSAGDMSAGDVNASPGSGSTGSTGATTSPGPDATSTGDVTTSSGSDSTSTGDTTALAGLDSTGTSNADPTDDRHPAQTTAGTDLDSGPDSTSTSDVAATDESDATFTSASADSTSGPDSEAEPATTSSGSNGTSSGSYNATGLGANGTYARPESASTARISKAVAANARILPGPVRMVAESYSWIDAVVRAFAGF